MGTIRQITFFDMPDGGVGTGGFGWAYAFPLATLSGSTILTFSEIAATGGGTISGVTDSNSNAHTSLDHLRNTSNGADFWSFIKENSPSIARGFAGRVGSGTTTTLVDDTLTQRGVTWATNEWAGLSYINFDSGVTGTVASNTSTTLTFSPALSGAPQPGSEYAIGGYAHVTLSTSGDYFGGIALEVTGVTGLVSGGHDSVQGDFSNGATVTCPSHALGSSPVTIIACCLNDTNVVNTPAIGSGFTDDGTYMKWDQAAKMARLQHRLLSNPGTTGATFVTTAADHYQALYAALLDTQTTTWAPRQTQFHPGRSAGLGSQRFYQSPRATTVAVVTDVTAALTGQAATFAAGTLSPATAKALTGSSIPSAAGTMAPGTSKALTGQAGTFAAGILTANTTIALNGQAATSAAGVLAPSTTLALTGQAATFAAGTVIPSVALGLSGQAATFSAGLLAPSTSIALTGQSATFTAGLLSVSGDVTLALTGQASTFGAGTLTPNTALVLLGGAASFSAGNLLPGSAPALTGASITTAAGGLSPSTTVPLQGLSASFTAGLVGILGDVTVALTGAAATFAAGALTPVAQPQVFSGGFLYEFQRAHGARRKRKRELEALADPIEREIAVLLHEPDDEAELRHLRALVAKFTDELPDPERVQRALNRAIYQETAIALRNLEHEIQRAIEDEDAALLLLLN